VNGLQLYYEAHGSGRPLVLLHGGIGARVSGVAGEIRGVAMGMPAPTMGCAPA
jgi:hypothetical protein